MSVYDFDQSQILLFFAALVRVSCLLIMLPVFGHTAIPSIARVLFCFSLTLIMFPTAMAQATIDPSLLSGTLGIALLVFKEALVGFVVGFVVKVFFEALSFAFSLIGVQMGFAMAAQYDPHMESSTPVVSQFILILATLLMLTTNTHHLMLRGLAQTFEAIPIGTGGASKELVGYMMELGNQVFIIGVRISAPMALVIFLINLAFGIISKAVPQINVLVVSLSVNVVAGFVVLLLVMPALGTNMNDVFADMINQMMQVTRYLHG